MAIVTEAYFCHSGPVELCVCCDIVGAALWDSCSGLGPWACVARSHTSTHLDTRNSPPVSRLRRPDWYTQLEMEKSRRGKGGRERWEREGWGGGGGWWERVG